MLLKPSKSQLHLVLELLNKRTKLPKEKLHLLKRLQLGYEGELQFYNLIKGSLSDKPLAIFDLLLEYDGTEFQIDCLIIFQYEIYLFEVKNYEGDFLWSDNNWYLVSKEKVKNPLHQINRTELLFTKFLKNNGLHMKVKSYLVFVNPQYTLYQAPTNLPIILPTQLQRFVKNMSNLPSETNNYHDKILNLLKTNHKKISSFQSSLDYNFDIFTNDIFCDVCDGTMEISNKVKSKCSHCGVIELIDDVILRAASEFQLLFPEKMLTVRHIQEWLDFKLSEYKIRKVLENHAALVGKCKSKFYRI